MLHNKTGYNDVNGLHMYYEIYGEGEPLLLLHGEFATVGMFSKIIPDLAKSHQVILVEQQGHGHTADIDHPLSFAQMAQDTATLLKELKIPHTDIFGYSGGGTVALQLALQYPKLIRKLAVSSAIYNENGYAPGIIEALKHPDPNAFPPELRNTYEKVAPQPQNWASLVYKSSDMAKNPSTAGFIKRSKLQHITSPTLVIIGEDDFIRKDYAKEMAKLLHTKLIIIPGDHSSYITTNPQLLLSTLENFFI